MPETRRDQLDLDAAGLAGLADTKRELDDYFSTQKKRPLLLLGPPGAGKTACAAAIAAALKRPLWIFEPSTRGVWIGQSERLAHLGLFRANHDFECSQQSADVAPVILIEKAHELQGGTAGPTATALCALAAHANSDVLKQYFGVSPDVAGTVFIFTCVGLLPLEAWYRFTVVRMMGYSQAEKIEIAGRLFGAAERQIPPATISALVRVYGEGPGVLRLAEIADATREADLGALSIESLEHRFAKPRPSLASAYSEPRSGEAIGLTWTAWGGSEIVIEAAWTDDRRNELTVLGNCRTQFLESARIALEVVRQRLSDSPLRSSVLIDVIHDNSDAAIDGSSAGLPIAMALYTLATGTRVRARWGFSGRLTLSARILPVDGCHAKLLVAERCGLSNVLLPKRNAPAFPSHSSKWRPDVAVHYVSTFDEALTSCIETSSPSAASRT